MVTEKHSSQSLVNLLKDIQLPCKVDWRCKCENPIQDGQFKQDTVSSISGDMLIIILGLFQTDDKGNTRKINPHVTIPRHLDFFGQWQLKAMVYHHGGSSLNGHYTCSVKVTGDQWLNCNDSVIEPIELDPFLIGDRSPPYIILFERQAQNISDNEMPLIVVRCLKILLRNLTLTH